MEKQEIINLFTQLCMIPSPSGHEKEIAAFLMQYLTSLGLEVVQDATGSQHASNAGNVYAYYSYSTDAPTIAFCAHMDTVQSGGDEIAVQFDGSLFRSSGNTILGADNKAGVTALLALAHQVMITHPKCNIIFFFPTREEAGIMGSSFFDPKIKPEMIFNIDNPDKPGVFIYASTGYLPFTIHVQGKAAHAAKEYEKGKNAISIATDLIHLLPLGKNEKLGTTLNIASFHGGSLEHLNVVCDSVVMAGELRGFSKEGMQYLQNLIAHCCEEIGTTFEVPITPVFATEQYIAPFQGSTESIVAQMAKNACRALGIESHFEQVFSTSDANSLQDLGYEVISLSRGGKFGHSRQEELLLDELLDAIKLLIAIVDICEKR